MTIKQTAIKTISYGTMHMGIAVLVAYALTKSWQIAFAIGLLEPCAQTIAYFFHERIWHCLEKRHKNKDHHDIVIDSTTPLSQWIEKILRRHR